MSYQRASKEQLSDVLMHIKQAQHGLDALYSGDVHGHVGALLKKIEEHAHQLLSQTQRLKSMHWVERLEQLSKEYKIQKVHMDIQVGLLESDTGPKCILRVHLQVKGGLPRQKNQLQKCVDQLCALQDGVNFVQWQKSVAAPVIRRGDGTLRYEVQGDAQGWIHLLCHQLWGAEQMSQWQAQYLRALTEPKSGAIEDVSVNEGVIANRGNRKSSEEKSEVYSESEKRKVQSKGTLRL